VATVVKQTIGEMADSLKDTLHPGQRGENIASPTAHLNTTNVYTAHDDAASQSCSRA
jgi:hypothetical protein